MWSCQESIFKYCNHVVVDELYIVDFISIEVGFMVWDNIRVDIESFIFGVKDYPFF